MLQNQKLFIKTIWWSYKMNKFRNLIGIKAKKACEIKINTITKNKVLHNYAQLLERKKKIIQKYS